MIGGFQPLSFIDFPGHLSAVVFFQGCNLACQYCHNKGLIKPQTSGDPDETCLEWLVKRKGLLTGVVLSGGEPTLVPGLAGLIRKIRDLGFAIKLDTNGMLPSVVETLVADGLLDYVAVDVKISPSNDFRVGLGSSFRGEKPFECLSLMHGRVDCEARTTVVRPWHTESELLTLLSSLVPTGVRKWFLQKYVGNEFLSVSNSLLGSVVAKARDLGVLCEVR